MITQESVFDEIDKVVSPITFSTTKSVEASSCGIPGRTIADWVVGALTAFFLLDLTWIWQLLLKKIDLFHSLCTSTNGS